MGCANTKAGATAYGAPEEAPAEGGEGSKVEVPKVVVDGEAQQQSAEMALNGSVVQNGADGDGTEGSLEKCNGGVNGDAKGADEICKGTGEEDDQKTGDSSAAPSGESESNENINGTTGDEGNDENEIKGATEEGGKDSGAAAGEGVPSDSGNDAAAESRGSSSQDGDGDNAE